MTDMQVPSDSLLGLPISLTPPRVDDTSEIVLSAEEAYDRQIAREREFVNFLEQLWPLLLRCASKVMKDEHDGEDVVQDALLKTWQTDGLARCRGDYENVKGYMLQAVYNCAYDAHRKRKGFWKFLEEWGAHINLWPKHSETADEWLMLREIDKIIAAALSQLQPKPRSAYRLVHELDLRYATAAEALQTTTKSVSAYLTMSCRHLRETLRAAGYLA